MRSLNSGARKKPWRIGSSYPSWKRPHACIRVLVFLFFHFPSSVVRSSKIEVFGMATVGRGYNEQDRHRVIKTLLDAGVESTRELSERSGLCKAPNEIETKKRLK